MIENNFSPLLAHGTYTMNLCSDKAEIRTYALDIFKDDLIRQGQTPNICIYFIQDHM